MIQSTDGEAQDVVGLGGSSHRRECAGGLRIRIFPVSDGGGTTGTGLSGGGTAPSEPLGQYNSGCATEVRGMKTFES